MDKPHDATAPVHLPNPTARKHLNAPGNGTTALI